MYRFSSGKTPFASTIRSIIVPVFVGPTIYGVSVQESSTTLQEQVDDQQHKKYGTISGVFRPTFMTIVGTFACMMAMFVINPLFGVISIVIVFAVYFYLTRRDIDHEEGDMRSGLFVSLAEWAARQTADLPQSNERSWKPNLLVPFTDERELRGEFGLIRDIVSPRGSVTLIGVHEPGQSLGETVPSLGRDFLSQGVSARWKNIYRIRTDVLGDRHHYASAVWCVFSP